MIEVVVVVGEEEISFVGEILGRIERSWVGL